ncbi:ribosomal RNA large subunit methyltransferase M [mine drainage metagenome]|uniref:Ribosomal RNA large subunit methyltransferase M n=1 Tax=mine drainage metagenome TaxID=410659 RepID=A0A1J5STM2_9ZZZZ
MGLHSVDGPLPFTAMLCTCQAGFESLLAEELRGLSLEIEAQGPGWVSLRAPEGVAATLDLAFAHRILPDTSDLAGDSVNGLAQQLLEFMLNSLRGERIEASWPCVFAGPAELVGLGRRISAVEKTFNELLRKRLSRVARLATPDLPRSLGPVRGLFVWFSDFGRFHVSRTLIQNGPKRMADDPLAPSRSYLKVEEAYGLLGVEPGDGETVIDLGAAPGGWSYSAAKRGARVDAIDNGPLKAGAANNPGIIHRMEDAFRVSPPEGAAYDWLFCDMVEEPHHVLRDIVEPWLSRRWCRRFVINLKFGRVRPLGLLDELRSSESPFVRHASDWRIRHLYHDREEFTVAGSVRSAE